MPLDLIAKNNRANSPLRQKICPVCGFEALHKYFNETKRIWVYKHFKRFEATVYHEAAS